jgi:SAM-dependent methyltransferase
MRPAARVIRLKLTDAKPIADHGAARALVPDMPGAMSGVPQIFDTRLRRLRRARAAQQFDAYSFLATSARDELADRLVTTAQPIGRALWRGAIAPPASGNVRWISADSVPPLVPAGGIVFDDEAVPFADHTLDAYVSVLTLHAVNDLPGALTQIRRCLRPNGLFMAALFGGRTLHELKLALGEAEIDVAGGLSPRVAPMVDVRDAGALLQRAGFVRPVADVNTVTVRYEHTLKLLSDLRGMGETNVLTERRRTFLRRGVLARACEVYAEKTRGGDGRIAATFEILFMTGFAPA